MTTTNSTQKNGSSAESTKNINNLFKETSETLFDVYKKQLNTASEYYNNLYSTFFEGQRKLWNPFEMYNNLIFNRNEGNKPGFMSFSNFGLKDNFSNMLIEPLENAFKQISNYNQDLFDLFNKQLESGNIDLSSVKDKYQEYLLSYGEASKNIVNSIATAATKRIELSTELNKNLQDDITREIENLVKQNQKMWSEILPASKNNSERRSFSVDGQRDSERKQEKAKVNN